MMLSLEAGVAYIYEPTAENKENKLYLNVPGAVTDYTKMMYTHTPKAAANGLVPVFEHTKLNIDNGIFNNDRTMGSFSLKKTTRLGLTLVTSLRCLKPTRRVIRKSLLKV